MPHVTTKISPSGPILDLMLGVSVSKADTLKEAGQPVPPLIAIRALVDTGASGTCIDPSHFIPLGLSPTGTTLMTTPSTGSTPHTCNTYDVSLIIRHPTLSMRWGIVGVSESKPINQGFDALLGRDILSQCILWYDGATGIFTLGF